MTKTIASTSISPETINAFHTMWGNFPHGVLLLKKDREIVAANRKSKAEGAIEGRKCFQLGGLADIHKGCPGSCAIDDQETQRRTYHDKSIDKIVDAYWLPVPTDEGLMLHFAVYVDPPREEAAGLARTA